MAISVTNDHDEQNHRRQPPMKHSSPRCRSCREHSDAAENKQERRERRRRNFLGDCQIPRRRHDLNSTRAEEMMRIKLRRDLVGMTVPKRGRQKRDRGKTQQL